MHPDKTRIVHIHSGFDFLGFSVRQFNGKCLVKPQKDKVLAFLRTQSQWLNAHRQLTSAAVIRHLNPILRGWSNYYRHVVSKLTFSYVASRLQHMLWRWCLRRHPNKSKHWVRQKYFGTTDNAWTFQARCRNAEGVYYIFKLFNIASIPIERHAKVRGTASPDDPSLNDYWRQRIEERKTRHRNRRVTSG